MKMSKGSSRKTNKKVGRVVQRLGGSARSANRRQIRKESKDLFGDEKKKQGDGQGETMMVCGLRFVGNASWAKVRWARGRSEEEGEKI